MEEKLNQILYNQSMMLTALAALYADDCEDVEMLNLINECHKGICKTLSPSKPKTK